MPIATMEWDKGRMDTLAEEVCKTSIRIPISEFFSEGNIRDMAKVIKKVVSAYLK